MLTDYTAKVTVLIPEHHVTWVQLSETVSQSDNYLVLRLDHPNYSSIFALLVASGANKLDIDIGLSAADPEGVHPAGGITWVSLTFPQ
jgi:hypothetical protein